MRQNSNVDSWFFIDEEGTFRLKNPHLNNYLYFPLANQAGMMSVISPTLHGDIKTGLNTFFSEPVSIEDLHNRRSSRNFWIYVEEYGPWSVGGNSAAQISQRYNQQNPERVHVEAGILWHSMHRENKQVGIKSKVTSFIPANNDQVELMQVTLTNIGKKTLKLTPTAAIPIFGRSADNLRDHRHVTSLLHRVSCNPLGVLVTPTLSFDERGHLPNTTTYAVLGCDQNSAQPEGFFPVLEDFIGEGGSLDWPQAIIHNQRPSFVAGDKIAGYEALGGIRFSKLTLAPGETHSWVIISAILNEKQSADEISIKYCSSNKINYWLAKTNEFWKQQVDLLKFQTADERFNHWLRWVAIQPTLRRWFGNSFMPYHDYGRGGRGWRDLWQDILALLIMDPREVEQMLIDNFAGVRMDGSNATIIGNKPGEFKADRNNIPRVWMDHGAWPLLTINLYINQTGNLDILLQEQIYFKDQYTHWCKFIDPKWTPNLGLHQRTKDSQIYKGTILEHLLVQHLSAFFNVGEHNNIRLEDADWNDGLDMASDKGESVAFTALYAYNLNLLANLIRQLGVDQLHLANEIMPLLDSLNNSVNYSSPSEKKQQLSEYFSRVEKSISGEKTAVNPEELAKDLQRKAEHIYTHIQKQEWIEDKDGRGWFNGYYNNDGNRLEGVNPQNTHMTLTGQVFTLMSGIASSEQTQAIIRAADYYLYDAEVGGYRLNTDFQEVLSNMGRAFGFAYGHKENGAMFSHMAVMYANALYKRGYILEGKKILDSIYLHSADFQKSRMYPGIPEYFSQRGRGMYPNLTGSASWYLLTMTHEVFGVRGIMGDLHLEPKLTADQFDAHGKASVRTVFAGKTLHITYLNPQKIDPQKYHIHSLVINKQEQPMLEIGKSLKISRSTIEGLSASNIHQIEIVLGIQKTNSE